MQNHEQQLRQIKTAIIATLITFLVVVSGLAVLAKQNQRDFLEKDLKISSLIDEVGELKEANDELYGHISARDRKLENVLQEISALNESFGEGLAQKEEALKKVQTTFQATRNQLLDLLKDRELTINTLAGKNERLKNELNAAPEYAEDIIDILLIGQNSGLTDSMMIASINPSNRTIALVSIPRDLYHKGRKINELYNLYGLEKLEESLYQITGVSIDRYAIFDFDAFVTLVDGLGGLDINVEKDLIDNQYPGPNSTYRTVTFKKGLHRMDGQTALKYVRSRKSTTDFDRSARQQQVLLAIKEKALSLNLLENIDAVQKIYNAIKDNLSTDLGIFEAMAYFDNYRNFAVKSGNIVSNRNFLYSTTSRAGQYILLPAGGTYADIKAYVAGLIKG